MARALVSQMPNCTLSVDYNANNRRVNGLFVSNQTGHVVYAEARFDQPVGGQTVWGQNFPVGDTLMSLPANLLTWQTINDPVKGETYDRLDPECSLTLSLLQ